jgi:hypothetical protein
MPARFSFSRLSKRSVSVVPGRRHQRVDAPMAASGMTKETFFNILSGGTCMGARIEFTSGQQAEISRLYTRTLTPVRDIAALMGVSRKTIQKNARRWGLPPRRPVSQPIELRHAVRGAVMADFSAGRPEGPPLSTEAMQQQRAAIALRILQAVEQEISAVQRVLAVLDPSNKDETERTTRTLASISRTLRDAAALNRPEDGTLNDDPEQDPIPGDIDEFRRELVRRIRGIVEAERRRRGAGRVDGPVAGGPAALG